jgi:predicted TIM-barrel fold metal-dependent hydrolase
MSENAGAGAALPNIAPPDPDPHPPKFPMPPGACDCHAHICGPQSRYPYSPDRRYTPHDALASDYVRLLRKLGIERGVLVQPSVYGGDNSMMLDALRHTDFPLRGVAVVNEDVTDEELEAMHAAGVRGIRLNLRSKGASAPADVAPRLARRIAPLGWHLQFRIKPEDFVGARAMIEALPVPLVIDHIGAVPVEAGVDGESFRIILDLVKNGRCYVKLSAPMRMSKQPFPYEDVTPFVQALVAQAPERMLWATDWPHTALHTAMPNDGDLCDLLAAWIPDAAVRARVLVDNPAEVYGF